MIKQLLNVAGLRLSCFMLPTLAVCLFTGTTVDAETASSKPNVLIVLVDDAGYGDYSCHGNPIMKTPNVDKLHKESVRLTDFHVAPMCTPTRGQLLTGMDCFRNGASQVATSRMLLRPGVPTAADIFAANGYRTGQCGKWHLGDNYPFRPQDRGFQDVLYFHLALIGQSDDYWANDYFDPWFRGADGVPRQFKGYCNDILFDEAMGWMRERAARKEPFFCYLPLNLVHGPHLVPQKYRDLYKDQKPEIASGFGMLANVDENVGRLDAFLHKTGLSETTIVIFMNDNGATFGGNVFNAGMRGRKREYFEGGHRSPCFIRWPQGKLLVGADVGELTEVQDILPSLVDLCGIKDTKGAKFDGVSLATALRGGKKSIPDRTLVVQFERSPKGDAAVMWQHWRLVQNKQLFDLSTDPSQEKNVIIKHPEVAAKMRARYDEWWNGVLPSFKKRSPIFVGDDHENPTTLTPSSRFDKGKGKSDAKYIRLATASNGDWFVKVVQDGDYEIAVRRWPEEATTPIRGTVPEWVSQDKGSNYKAPAGVALPITKARIMIGDYSDEKPVGESDTAAVFNAKLKAGETMLNASFFDAKMKELGGAYFVTVRRK